MDLLSGDDHTARDELLAKWKDKTKEELLEAKINSDLYVNTLTKRQDDISKDYLEARKQLDAQASLQELVDRLNAKTESSSTPTIANEESHKYDPKEVETLVLNKIKQNKLDEKEVSNFSVVETKLKERYGDNYRSVLKEQQSQLGLSTDDVNALAKKSPEAFFRVMGLDQQKQESFQTPPRSAQRNDQFSPKGQPKRDWNYYQELKKTNPTLYLDRKIAIDMHNDAMEQGEAFYNNS